MTLKDRIYKDMISAMKAKDAFKKNILSMVRASILQVEKDKGSILDDEGVINVISKEIKQRKEVLHDYEKGKRQDLIDKTKREIEIMLDYMPQQLTEEEIDKIVKSVINEIGVSNKNEFGRVMSKIMPLVKGRADGNTVKKIILQHLH
ncbi:GatB/YqeY domain-containing protein [Aceticella autotrophica]|uniref:GatB/YqeY domain-containing protein n=1 Tax=Aceticella autotrophica TaxID=2755338 RepID=A0A975AX97_9THEO|nr:GatB/YqeY domain-containing protein [Aceticella autotrophica]QSZ28172.1 GatB/YqeY domain-containing protein [Aceticella autotrophica]